MAGADINFLSSRFPRKNRAAHPKSRPSCFIAGEMTSAEREARQANKEMVEANRRLVISIAKNTPTAACPFGGRFWRTSWRGDAGLRQYLNSSGPPDAPGRDRIKSLSNCFGPIGATVPPPSFSMIIGTVSLWLTTATVVSGGRALTA